jgi:hypothetical protein
MPVRRSDAPAVRNSRLFSDLTQQGSAPRALQCFSLSDPAIDLAHHTARCPQPQRHRLAGLERCTSDSALRDAPCASDAPVEQGSSSAVIQSGGQPLILQNAFRRLSGLTGELLCFQTPPPQMR